LLVIYAPKKPQGLANGLATGGAWSRLRGSALAYVNPM
jgi:hypothetical protein